MCGAEGLRADGVPDPRMYAANGQQRDAGLWDCGQRRSDRGSDEGGRRVDVPDTNSEWWYRSWGGAIARHMEFAMDKVSTSLPSECCCLQHGQVVQAKS